MTYKNEYSQLDSLLMEIEEPSYFDKFINVGKKINKNNNLKDNVLIITRTFR